MSTAEAIIEAWDARAATRKHGARLSLRAAATWAYWTAAAAIFIVVGWQRVELARSTSLRCDELPLLMNSTGMCGQASTEAEAQAFAPSLYTFRRGVVRSLRPPIPPASLQTSSAFGAHLGVHLLGYSPFAVRLWPWCWSMVALIAVGWTVRRAGGGRIAVLVAMVFVGLSPLAHVYAAQARGYSESVCAAAILLAGLSRARRCPSSRWTWWVVGFACVQSAVSVYTTWVYWSVPVLSAAWLQAAVGEKAPGRRAYVAALAGVTIAVMLFVGLYTLDRFDVLVGQATSTGQPIASFTDAAAFFQEFGRDVLGPGVWLMVLAPFGIVVLWRGACRWWLVATGLTLASIIVAANVIGSAGYVRNVLFLLAPMAVVSALGIERVVIACMSANCQVRTRADSSVGRLARSMRRWVAPGAVGVVVVASVGWASVSLAQAGQRARLFLPDWGRAVARVIAWEGSGAPCWLLRCEAFHRVIDWYGGPADDAVAAALNGDSFRVVLASQCDEHGRARVYRTDARQGAIREEPVPLYIARCAPAEVVDGVELRAWQATPTRLESMEHGDDSPVLLVARLRESSPVPWRRLCDETQADDLGVVPFTPHVLADGTRAWPLLVPSPEVRRLAAVLDASRDDGVIAIKAFTLTP